jgi:LEA14-like dessication related protein
MNMKRTVTVVLSIMALAAFSVFLSSCGVVGADVRMDGLSLGTIAMEGKSFNGLPSDKVNFDLDVAAQTIKIRTSANVTTLTLVPSGAVIEISGENISLKGFKSEQVKVEWNVKPPE